MKIIIVGAGGFGREVAWVISRMNLREEVFALAGFCDDDVAKATEVARIAPYLGSVQQVVETHAKCGFICAVGNNKIRSRLVRQFNEAGFMALSVVDPSAVIAVDATVGGGSFIGVNSVVSAGCQIGAGCIVNHNATVGHDVMLDDFAQVCPGVAISGGCHIGTGALLGSNSCTIPCKSMGAWSTLGAGGVLISDLEDGGSRVRIR